MHRALGIVDFADCITHKISFGYFYDYNLYLPLCLRVCNQGAYMDTWADAVDWPLMVL